MQFAMQNAHHRTDASSFSRRSLRSGLSAEGASSSAVLLSSRPSAREPSSLLQQILSLFTQLEVIFVKTFIGNPAIFIDFREVSVISN
jgi:hypothetical protein